MSSPRATQNLYPREPKDFLTSCSTEDIATILEALPAVTVEDPLPAFGQLADNDVNFANVGGNLNLSLGNDFLDISVTDDHSTTDSHDVTVSNSLNPETTVEQNDQRQFDFLNPNIGVNPGK